MTPETPSNLPWWNKERHAMRRERLLMRGKIRRAIIHYLEQKDFQEIEAGQLQLSPGNETHLHAFTTDLRSMDGQVAKLHLHTSPEFACKKLLAAGERRIFDFARVFRNRERGALHAPEFTMLEWYRAGESYDTLIHDCGAFLKIAAEVAARDVFTFRDRSIDPSKPPEVLTVADAFHAYAGIDLLASVDGTATNRDDLAAQAQSRSIRIAEDDSWSDIFSKVLVEKIEPMIGNGRATVLTEYPIPEAALARRKPGSTKVAERFELYACGVELANAFGELTEAKEQRQRFEADMAVKQRIYGERYPLDEE
ncbi:MAG: EF-P lysine aminoacylase EpmA, partial [Beijerinckiaceae bacterium]